MVPNRYVKSRNEKQLEEKSYENEIDGCSPIDKTKGGAPIVPCGLIAWSLFNDTYGFTVGDKPLSVNKKNIAWPSDKSTKFGSNVYPKNFQSGNVIGGGKLDSNVPVSMQFCLCIKMYEKGLH